MTSSVPPVSDETIASIARDAQERIDGSVGAPSMIVGCYTLASLCAELRQLRTLAEERRLGPREG